MSEKNNTNSPIRPKSAGEYLKKTHTHKHERKRQKKNDKGDKRQGDNGIKDNNKQANKHEKRDNQAKDKNVKYIFFQVIKKRTKIRCYFLAETRLRTVLDRTGFQLVSDSQQLNSDGY